MRDQPVVGMAILRGIRRERDDFTQGTILDPDEGETYRCTVTMKDGGNRLEIRGYLGLPVFGRTQTWTRVE